MLPDCIQQLQKKEIKKKRKNTITANPLLTGYKKKKKKKKKNYTKIEYSYGLMQDTNTLFCCAKKLIEKRKQPVMLYF